MIKLISINKNPLWFNIDHIVRFSKCMGNTNVCTSNGTILTVNETPERIIELIKKEKQAQKR